MNAKLNLVPPIRMIGAEQLRAQVSFDDLIEPVSRAFQDSSAGRAGNGLIVMYPEADRSRGDVYVKTGTLEGRSVYIVKVSPWFACNVEANRAQGGFIAVFDSATGHTIALLDEQHYLSDIRTAAAGALAARVLAPADIETAAILGAGVQAYWQALALFRERKFRTLHLWARSVDTANALRGRLSGQLPGVTIRLSPIETAVRAADVIVTATAARQPILRGDWLRPGQHITAVGADDPSKCEIDADALRLARVFVDSIPVTESNGDVCRAIEAGLFSADQLAGEIGDVLAGRSPGRQSKSDITIAKFVGIGAQDLAAAEVAVRGLTA